MVMGTLLLLKEKKKTSIVRKGWTVVKTRGSDTGRSKKG
jgi:hypothetical protein